MDADPFQQELQKLDRLEPIGPKLGAKCSIFAVPPEMRASHAEAYTPKFVSVGPHHYRGLAADSPLKDMEDSKLRILKLFLRQAWEKTMGHLQRSQEEKDASWPGEVQALMREWMKLIEDEEAAVRSYYAYKITMRRTDLVLLMLRDGLFLLYRLFSDYFPSQCRKEVEFIPGRIRAWELAFRDLLLVENQIPFFIVQKLLNNVGPKIGMEVGEDIVVEAARRMFRETHPLEVQEFPTNSIEVHHLLHLFYMSRLPQPPPPPSPSPPAHLAVSSGPDFEIGVSSPLGDSSAGDQRRPPRWIPCAKELALYGITFRASKKGKSVLDVSFGPHGAMEIPNITLYDESKDLFRNLIAFEQCYHGCRKAYFSVYAVFMDCIIKKEEDARRLQLKGIITNQMSGDQDLTAFFGELSRGVCFGDDEFYLKDLFRDVTDYREKWWHELKGEINRRYFSNKWGVFAGVVTLVLFVFSTTNTYFSFAEKFSSRKLSFLAESGCGTLWS